MTVTEEARHRLHGHLEEIMGEQHAAALLEWAPNGPIASKADVEEQFAHLREVMDLRFAAVDARFDAVDARFDAVDARFAAVDKRFETVATKEDLANLRADLHSTLRMHTLVIIGAMGTMISPGPDLLGVPSQRSSGEIGESESSLARPQDDALALPHR